MKIFRTAHRHVDATSRSVTRYGADFFPMGQCKKDFHGACRAYTVARKYALDFDSLNQPVTVDELIDLKLNLRNPETSTKR